jgi:hypothetical protein
MYFEGNGASYGTCSAQGYLLWSIQLIQLTQMVQMIQFDRT